MKCLKCNKKVFKNITDEVGRIGRFRRCVNCGTLAVFGWDIYEEIKKREVKDENERKKVV